MVRVEVEGETRLARAPVRVSAMLLPVEEFGSVVGAVREGMDVDVHGETRMEMGSARGWDEGVTAVGLGQSALARTYR